MYLFRIFVLAVCIILAGLSASPADAGILAKIFGRGQTVSVSKSKTKSVAAQPTAKKVRQPCRMVNGRLVCPS